MSDNDSTAGDANQGHQAKGGSSRRNLVLGLILAAVALTMYVSIFFRLSYNPLG